MKPEANFKDCSLAPAPPLKLYNIGQTSRIGENIIEDDDEEEDDMRSSKPKYHKSEKILGRLYRSVDENKVWKVDIQKIVNAVPTTMWFDLMQIVEEDFRSKGLTIDYRRQLDAAWRIRNLYEGALVDMIWTFSDNPRKHISEVEAFCGFILNKRGSQTRRQRDASIKLREEMDRLLSWIAKLIRKKSHGEEEEEEEDGSAGIESVLELCLACVYVGCTPRKRSASQSQDSDKDYKSFKSIAACCLLSELIALETMVPDDSLGSHGGGGGGYIGVSIRPHHGELMLPLRGANTQSTARPCTLPGLT
jgi:hypothetical protein